MAAFSSFERERELADRLDELEYEASMVRAEMERLAARRAERRSSAAETRDALRRDRPHSRTVSIVGAAGGVGCTALASNLLVAARRSGLNAVGIDLHALRSLATWARQRAAVGRAPACEVIEANRLGWWHEPTTADLVIVDTPSEVDVDERDSWLDDIVLHSDLIIVPTPPRAPTYERTRDLAMALVEVGGVVACVINEADERRRSTHEARMYLRALSEFRPAEIPQREDVHRAMRAGYAVVDWNGFNGHEEMKTLWRLVAERLGIELPSSGRGKKASSRRRSGDPSSDAAAGQP